jgi:hypothetical protein
MVYFIIGLFIAILKDENRFRYCYMFNVVDCRSEETIDTIHADCDIERREQISVLLYVLM